MALSKHPRRFILKVTEINAKLLVDEDYMFDRDDIDEVVIEFAGKIMPSTKKRLELAINEANYKLIDKVLT